MLNPSVSAVGSPRVRTARKRWLTMATAAIAALAVAVAKVSLNTGANRVPGQKPAPNPAPNLSGLGPHGPSGNWTMILDEDFTHGFDKRYWSNSRYGNGKPSGGFNRYDLECFIPAQTTVAGGVANLTLVAQPRRCSGKTYPYTSGILTTYGK